MTARSRYAHRLAAVGRGRLVRDGHVHRAARRLVVYFLVAYADDRCAAVAQGACASAAGYQQVILIGRAGAHALVYCYRGINHRLQGRYGAVTLSSGM
jgi:hypothetical protein